MLYRPLPPDRTSPVDRFLWGVRYAGYGANVVVTNPRLWWLVAVPALMSVGLFVGGFFSLGVALPWLLGFVWSPGPHTPDWAVFVYHFVLWTFRLSVAVSLGVLLYLTAGLLATPFNDRLSELVERSVLGRSSEPAGLVQGLRDLGWSFTHSVLSLGLYLLVMAVAALLNLLPGLGSVASFLLGSVASGLFFAREAMDGCFSRRRMRYAHKWRVVLHHWPIALGFGMTVGLLLWVPLLNFLVLPMSVAGGTLLFCHLERDGHLPEDLRVVPNVVPDR